MDTDFIYSRHKTAAGIKIEQVYGGAGRSEAVWRAMARQVYKENGRDEYRDIDHTPTGAPLLVQSEEQRISLTHTHGLLVVATLPPVEGADLTVYSAATALGVDAECADREQVLRIRERFMAPEELKSIPAGDVELNIQAWTAKEAIYKACLTPGLDLRNIVVEELPSVEDAPEAACPRFGVATATLPDGTVISFRLFTFRSAGCFVTTAWTDDTVTFKK